MEKLDSYFETTDDSLWSYIENTIWKMSKENKEYNSLTKKIESLLDEHPNLRHVLEDEIVTEISIDDAKALKAEAERRLDLYGKDDFDVNGNRLKIIGYSE